ncbi:hypothetical protein ABIC60_000632 [Phyllobacterium ifriqiyense]
MAEQLAYALDRRVMATENLARHPESFLRMSGF